MAHRKLPAKQARIARGGIPTNINLSRCRKRAKKERLTGVGRGATGAMGVPPVAGGATCASGSGRNFACEQQTENFGHRNRTRAGICRMQQVAHWLPAWAGMRNDP